jgi:hypothetical protein
MSEKCVKSWCYGASVRDATGRKIPRRAAHKSMNVQEIIADVGSAWGSKRESCNDERAPP